MNFNKEIKFNNFHIDELIKETPPRFLWQKLIKDSDFFKKFKCGCKYNKIIFFDLLKPDEKTCVDLYNYVLARFPNNNTVIYEPIYSKRAFINKLIEIENNCKSKNLKPILHIEAHGTESNGLLISKTISYISYPDLINHFRDINKACNNNLQLIMPSCFGALLPFLIKDKSRCSPFYYLLAPISVIKEGEILKLETFYEQLFITKNFAKAWKHSIQKSMILYNCEELFIISFIYTYYTQFKTMSDEKQKELFYKYKEKYLLSNTIENSKRFCYTYSDFKSLIQTKH